MENLVIIGHGPAGLTAAIYAARAGLSPLVLHSSSELGQLDQTTDVENFPGFPEGIMGPDIIKDMHKQAERFGTNFKMTHVRSIDGDSPFTLAVDDGEIQARSIILATGARPRRLGLDSESKYWGNGVSACAVCDGFFYREKEILVIGGGDSACEEATFLTKFASKVYMIHRRDELRASKIMARRALDNPKIEIVWNSVLDEVLGNVSDGVTGARLKCLLTSQTQDLPVTGVFLAIGHIPNTSPFQGVVEMDDEGYVVIEEGSTRTSKNGIFAAGDLHDKNYRQAVTAAGFGCMAALDAERFLSHQG
jgi:thioredoxin reductase (NADPH)